MAHINRKASGSHTRILLVGMGDPGGVGRYERLLLSALRAIEDDGQVQIKTLWRKTHPSYLDETSDARPSESLLRFVARVAACHARWRPDVVVYSHINLARLAGVLVPLSPRTQSVICLHGIDAWVELKGPRMTALKRAGRVVTTTSYMQDYVQRVHHIQSSKVVRIPLSLEPQWFEIEPTIPPSEGVILTVCRLDSTARHKGVDKMIRALPTIGQTVPTLRYIIVGNGDDVAFLRELSEENGAEHFISWAGTLTDAELCSAYNQCDVFALPSDNEGFGLVFLEAMAYAKPIVAWDSRGVSDVIVDEETGMLVNTNDALAVAIINLLNDPPRSTQMGREGYRRLHDQFSYDLYIKNWREVLFELTRHSFGVTSP
jgi:glycosyltransferase involved in cell wall biosynthesis